MNFDTLKRAEKRFLKNYPGGFGHPEMVEIGKKHNVDKLSLLAKEGLRKDCFNDVDEIVRLASKIVTTSSMVSMFEKPKFRDFTKGLIGKRKKIFVEALYEQLHGDKQKGFELFLSELESHKLAKWTLITAIPFYFKPKKEYFIKPMTTKAVIQNLEIDLEYKPKPSWDFYRKYRTQANKMKKAVDKSLSPNHAAFTGFLMMSFMDL